MTKPSIKNEIRNEIGIKLLIKMCDETNKNSPEGSVSITSNSNENIDCDDTMYSGAENLIYLSTYLFNLNTEISHLTGDRICLLCGTSKTPLWRRTHEYHTLCNACGIRERNINSKIRR